MRSVLRSVLLPIAIAATGCGSSGGDGLPPDRLDHDAAPAIAGSWSGTGSLAYNGARTVPLAAIKVVASGRNKLTFLGLCDGWEGPVARVTADTFFSFGPSTCTVTTDSCTLLWFIDTGNGVILDGELSFWASGRIQGCNILDWTLSANFTGTLGGSGTTSLAVTPPGSPPHR